MHGLEGDIREGISYYDDLHQSTGRFDFAPGSPAPERSFDASVTEVILEATRRLDEEGAGG